MHQTNQPTKFRTKNWVEINDDARGMYNSNRHIKFKDKGQVNVMVRFMQLY